MSVTCDVLVVGAGPAGLSAAFLLSKNGFSTVVLEKNKTPGSPQTSYDITEGSRICKILNEMKIRPLKISPVSEWFSPNHSFILDSKVKDYYFKRGPEKDSIENILQRKLLKNNVNVLYESYINKFEIKKKEITEVTVKATHEKIIVNPKYIIGADGAESNLRNRLQIDTNIYATFRGFGVVVESEKRDENPHAKIYFDKYLAPGGYIYSGSVKNKSFYCVVIDDIFSKKTRLRKNLEKFLKEHTNSDFIVKNYFGGIGTSGVHKIHVKNVLLVGGAALFYDPFLGYGLNYAFESAYTAAQAIIQNNIEMYKKYVKEIQQELKDMYITREIWRKADNNFFDRLIKAFHGEYDIKDKEINKILAFFNE
jgi:flavin-dependent dehydrogenase